jgi:two-component system phosphate regulon sensor histidine kinase PhoR
MEDPRNYQLRLLSFAVIAYMLMAFTWWTILLFSKNQDAFESRQELLRQEMADRNLLNRSQPFQDTQAFQALKHHYQRQERMIIGEAAVFVLSLVAGIWFINRGYHKEMVAATQRRNFLLSITHELKSPIASIRLVLETLLKRELGRTQTEKLSANALKDTERLHLLVENLLLSAKLETAYQPDYSSVYLPGLLDEIIAKLCDKYPGTLFPTAYQMNIPHWYGDKMGFTSIALNLLENAVKYSNQPSAMIITRLAYSKKPAGFVLQVADQGPGIPDLEKRRVFKKFYRLGNEDTRNSKGTGLGLYIVEQLVKAHQGKIKVSDNFPKGTIFEVFLPELPRKEADRTSI